MGVGRVRAPPTRRLKVDIRFGPVARRAVGGLGHFMCFLRVRAHRYAVSQRLLDLLCAAFFATAPPALLSLPRTSAAVTELLFRIYCCCMQAFQRRLRTDASLTAAWETSASSR